MRIHQCVVLATALGLLPATASAQRIGFEWGVNVEGGGKELGVTVRATNGKFAALNEKSELCVAQVASSDQTPPVSVCLTPDVITQITTSVNSHDFSFGLQEFEVVSKPYAGKGEKAYWSSVVGDVAVLVHSVAYLCGAPGAAEPPSRTQVTSPPRTPTDAEQVEKLDGDRCFVPYAKLRHYLATRNVTLVWSTETKDTENGGVPGVFVKIKDTSEWAFQAGAQATVDIDLAKLSDANVVQQLFDGHAHAALFPAIATTVPANQRRRENALRLLWHSVVSETENDLQNRAQESISQFDVVSSPGGRKDAYIAFPKSLLGAVLGLLSEEDRKWVTDRFIGSGLDPFCTNMVNTWNAGNWINTDRSVAGACNNAFTEARQMVTENGNTANPARVSKGKEIGPKQLMDGSIIVMMELRTTQPISSRSKLRWVNHTLVMPDADGLQTALAALYP